MCIGMLHIQLVDYSFPSVPCAQHPSLLPADCPIGALFRVPHLVWGFSRVLFCFWLVNLVTGSQLSGSDADGSRGLLALNRSATLPFWLCLLNRLRFAFIAFPSMVLLPWFNLIHPDFAWQTWPLIKWKFEPDLLAISATACLPFARNGGQRTAQVKYLRPLWQVPVFDGKPEQIFLLSWQNLLDKVIVIPRWRCPVSQRELACKLILIEYGQMKCYLLYAIRFWPDDGVILWTIKAWTINISLVNNYYCTAIHFHLIFYLVERN